MSTCPEKDIHSIYLDNELPLSYMKEYEEHISNCPKCAAELEKLKVLREAYAVESESLNFSQEDLDKSFERLQAKMSYSKTVKSSSKNVLNFSGLKNSVKYIATGVAAAAAVALILPVKNANKTSSVNLASSNFEPIQRSSSADFSNFSSAPAASGLTASTVNFGNNSISGELGSEISEFSGIINNSSNPQITGYRPENMPVPPEGFRPGLYGANNQNVNYNQAMPDRASLATYDLFTPLPESNSSFVQNKCSEESKGFSIKLSSPFANFSLEIGGQK